MHLSNVLLYCTTLQRLPTLWLWMINVQNIKRLFLILCNIFIIQTMLVWMPFCCIYTKIFLLAFVYTNCLLIFKLFTVSKLDRVTSRGWNEMPKVDMNIYVFIKKKKQQHTNTSWPMPIWIYSRFRATMRPADLSVSWLLFKNDLMLHCIYMYIHTHIIFFIIQALFLVLQHYKAKNPECWCQGDLI